MAALRLWSFVVITAVVFGCGGCGAARPRSETGPAARRAPIPCGSQTCGPDEYCEIRCTCCGIPIADPSQASAAYTCRPLPDRCAASDDGECGGRRVAEIPCA